MFDGLSKCLEVTNKTIRNRIKEHGSFEIDNKVVDKLPRKE